MWSFIESKINNQEDLSETELKWLLERESASELDHLYALANQANLRLNGHVVTFVHNMNVNYTNICEYRCTFCEFKKTADSSEAYILTFNDVKERIDRADGKLSEITYQGGLSDSVDFWQTLDLLREIKSAYPDLHAHAFSPEEIHFYARKNNLSYRDTIAKCIEAGMDSMCGTAAEVLDDAVRKKICWEKVSTDQWIDIVRTGHELGLRSTATILFGHLETPDNVMNHLEEIRTVQRKTQGITEFIPLLFMPDKTKLGRMVSLEMDRITYAFKLMAAARLYFMNDIRNIQVSWVKMGWENALLALARGANDMGGTLYYENITREAGGTNGEYTPKAKFIYELTRIGKKPFERDTIYSHQKELTLSANRLGP
ncbi:MAG: 7,8-didemethyl-8-hydroxy-5-deazariboflavin synthase subunit CofH [Candidatus Omnitrophica bacterium CG11_big_fil_rev_8_21_14_0_20_45_26]|uniref:7,8-didemethyl-8-hydroxy-5-deazariboflavin synthase subunit CofH n=1 Tax=Candidatus Abzuiibacterium crystallinum TaxID=1974748 RepID=A0A2H0LMR8_9BACT|nr:MAG: 7,8-didemethyl-8-hydroxy-5-deazariboflavin synthase subunit CofH [Candidatus Omnitrophica bacterium CG11_big_fil_rev_8_21_14_0_20_45_26]PIW64127.1 MAG: 7,8-didemethyl-8-hydroxy-5-deazariboflavin synthase subunit CofH [Candidatus Omnitrophica bacterium CG12_big_fil_rev_8_21_14_0_65_45_16]